MAFGRRTKIVCTKGPSCETDDILYHMILAGADAARFNFSHGSHEEQGMRVEAVRRLLAGGGRRTISR